MRPARGSSEIPDARREVAYVPDMGYVGSVQFSEVDKTAVRAGETSSVEVERTKVVVEIHMQPLAACRLRSVSGYLDETNTYSTVPRLGGDHLVLNPRMHKTVPNDVDEPDRTISISGSDPSEAVFGDERLPIIYQLAVSDRTASSPRYRSAPVERGANRQGHSWMTEQLG